MNRARLAIAGAVAAAFVLTTGVVANADPDAVEKARQDLEKIHQQASAIDLQIIEASERVQVAEGKLEVLKKDTAAQEAKVAKLSSELGEVAALQLQGDSISLTAQLLTSGTSDHFLSGLATLHSEIDRSNAGIQQLQLDQAKLTTLRDDAAVTEAQLKKDRDATIALAKDFDVKEAQAQAVYDRLSREERERLERLERERIAREEAAQARAEQRAREAEAASRSRAQATPAASADAAPAAAPASSAAPAESSAPAAPAEPADTGTSNRALAAVAAAKAQVGKRYVWGTSGANTFDCSGLTSYAYRQVGINISRSSRVQWQSAGRRVSKSELKPGDLVFYYSPVSHVGIYIGNGKIVDAANPRKGVRITSLSSMPFAGARRVVG